MGAASVAAAVFGNLLEVFDFIAYGIFAVAIGRCFFPSKDAYLSLLLSVTTFGVGFVTRPLGALLIGILADRRGRRAGMIASLGLMGLGSLTIAVLPGYATLGIAAPVLLLLARMIQGIAWGAEAGPATAFLLENAPPSQRGYFASWQSASQMLAVLLAGSIGFLSALLGGEATMNAWGWRIPFALGVLVVPVGLLLRRGMEEAPRLAESSADGASLFQSGWVALACATMLVIAGTVSQYFINYVTTYALTSLHLPETISFLGTVIAGVVGTAAALGGGALSDRIGLFPIVVLPRILLGLLIVPMLVLLQGVPGWWSFALVTASITLLQVGSFAASLRLLLELFPAQKRSTGFGLLYALGISVFGGTAQIVFTFLIHWTGNPASPSWYLALVNLLCAGAGMVLIRGRR
ncbi:MFS transporter [Acetobacteraceae bacterium KSS8]|uniref:MFS transporter n=1 Tax=Endosaccharibacter trunci TaxID=2812733 RepID=A0ABT1W2P3_9PROT|nr:MFS transporter [Acetobacteraceae bacterium KSS8]